MVVLGYIVFLILLLLVTFFGIGPVVFADGVMTERLITLAIVIIIYIILFALFKRWKKWIDNK